MLMVVEEGKALTGERMCVALLPIEWKLEQHAFFTFAGLAILIGQCFYFLNVLPASGRSLPM